MNSIRRAMALALLVNLGAALCLPHQHPQPREPRESVVSSTHAAPPAGSFLAAESEADGESSVCNLCILQRLLSLGLGASTHALQAPSMVGVLARTPHPLVYGVASYSGNPRGPPIA